MLLFTTEYILYSFPSAKSKAYFTFNEFDSRLDISLDVCIAAFKFDSKVSEPLLCVRYYSQTLLSIKRHEIIYSANKVDSTK